MKNRGCIKSRNYLTAEVTEENAEGRKVYYIKLLPLRFFAPTLRTPRLRKIILDNPSERWSKNKKSEVYLKIK